MFRKQKNFIAMHACYTTIPHDIDSSHFVADMAAILEYKY